MFKELFPDDNERGVSPVIGVILMVAITVILAAVIGAFVLNLGDQVTDTSPQASIDFDFQGTQNVTITHTGGDTLQNDSVSVIYASNELSTDSWASGNEISAGDELDLNDTSASLPASPGDEVRVIWNGDGGSSSVIASREFP